MNSTMQDVPLTITSLLRRGGSMFPESEVITFEGERSRHTKFPDVAARVPRLAAALRDLGVRTDDRVGTLLLEPPGAPRGLPRHPVHGRGAAHAQPPAFPEQLAYVINHAEDQVVIVDASLAPLSRAGPCDRI